MQRQRAEGDEKRPGDIPGDAQHEITLAFRENPGAHGAGSHSSLATHLAESSTSRTARSSPVCHRLGANTVAKPSRLNIPNRPDFRLAGHPDSMRKVMRPG